MKLHPFTLLLLIYFAVNSSVPRTGFSFFKKGVCLIGFFFKESIDFGTSRKSNTVEKQPERSQSGFWWEKPCISPVVTKYTIKWESDGRKVSIGYGKNGYQFPRLSQFHGFHCIFPCYVKLKGKPMYFTFYKVYHRIWIYWKKAPILWEKYEYQFSRFST